MANRIVYVVCAEGEEQLADQLAGPLKRAGYEVAHNGTVTVGESLVGEAQRALASGAAVVLCATAKAVGSAWAHQIVNAAQGDGSIRVFVVQMEKQAYVAQLAMNTRIARYCDDRDRALTELLDALAKHYPNMTQSSVSARSESQSYEPHFLDQLTECVTFDIDAVQQFRSQMREEAIRRYPASLSAWDFLEGASLRREGRLTRTAVLLFGEDPTAVCPTAMVKCARYYGNDRAANREIQTFDGTIPEQIFAAREFIAERVQKGEMPSPDQAQSVVAYDYPMIAVREIIANALVHRDYSAVKSCIHIRLFPDSLEVSSPGIWLDPKLVTETEYSLADLEGQSVKRNYWLAHILSMIRLVEGEGSGISSALQACRTSETPIPTVRQSQGFVIVTLKPQPQSRYAPEAIQAQETLSVGRPTTHQIPSQLPADVHDFIGRAEQLDTLRDLLADPEEPASPGAVRVALITGSGGVGKTTLAVHTAHLLASQFPDGQLYANLGGAAKPADPTEILAGFLSNLGAERAQIPLGERERAAYYRTRLAGRSVLIVLDDARDAAQVRPLLPGSASCAVLITSRGSLPELVESKVIHLDVLSRSEARTLFALVAGQDRAMADPDAIDDVLSACADLPLAIRIVGARLAARGSWTVRTLADRLADERRRLDVLSAGNLAVRASFEVSLASLPAPATPDGIVPARAFRLLGLWTGPSISLAAAAALLGENEDEVADALDVLVDAHLLESPAPDRYRLHDLLHVYAADRARSQETEEVCAAAVIRMLSWYLYTAEAAAQVISSQRRQVPLGPVPPVLRPLAFATLDEALAWCEHERLELMAAVRLAAASGLHELAWKLPAAAMVFYSRRSHWADWVTVHEIGLASARSVGDRLAEAWMLNNLGIAYGVQRREESLACFEQALALSRELGNGPGEAQAVTNIANTYFRLGNFAEARGAALRSLDIERRAGDRFGEGIALSVLGSACRELGEFGEAIEYLDQALAILREFGDRMSEAEALSDLGETYLHLHRIDSAVGSLSESLAISQDIGHRHGEAATLQRLARAHQLVGDEPRAHALMLQALHLFEELGDHVGAAEALEGLSAVADKAVAAGSEEPTTPEDENFRDSSADEG